jgi:SAM-dependent methyltransferase
MAERFGTSGTGVDLDEASIAQARRRAASRAAVRFIAGDASQADLPAGAHAVAACLGSSHALGGLVPTLKRLAELVRPGGWVLVADGFWRRPPEQPYLDALGAAADELPDLSALVRAGEGAGLVPVQVLETTTQDWDRYEWTLILNGERYAAEHPDDPVTADLRAWVAAARERCLGPGGRDTLGFALVAWLRPAAAAGT